MLSFGVCSVTKVDFEAVDVLRMSVSQIDSLTGVDETSLIFGKTS